MKAVPAAPRCFLSLASCSSPTESILPADSLRPEIMRALICWVRSLRNWLVSLPAENISSSFSKVLSASPSIMRSMNSNMKPSAETPSTLCTTSMVTAPCEKARHWSSMLSASLTPPSAFLTMVLKASSSKPVSRSERMYLSLSSRSSWPTRLKSNLWHLDLIVSGIFSGSVVASMKTVCEGGSSSILSSALKAPFESMCTSSIIYTLFLAFEGA